MGQNGYFEEIRTYSREYVSTFESRLGLDKVGPRYIIIIYVAFEEIQAEKLRLRCHLNTIN